MPDDSYLCVMSGSWKWNGDDDDIICIILEKICGLSNFGNYESHVII